MKNKQIENKTELITSMETALDRERISNIDNFDTRECTSENWPGVSVTITGPCVPIRPLLEAVEMTDDWFVESVGMYNDIPVETDSDEEQSFTYGVTLFCAYTGQKPDNDIFV